MKKTLLFLFLVNTMLMQAQTNLNQALGDLQNITQNEQTFDLTTTAGKLQITVFSANIIRVRAVKEDFSTQQSYAVTGTVRTSNVQADLTSDPVRIITDSVVLEISRKPTRLKFLTTDGQVINEDDAAFGTSWVGQQVTTYKKLQDRERFIGLGEKTGPLDRRGNGYSNWNTDNPSYNSGSDPIYGTHPFYIGLHHSLCYGIFFDNSYRSHFNFGASNNRFSSFGAEDGEMDYYFMYHNSVAQLIELYTYLTGRMPMPALWSLGFQQCRWSYYPEADVLTLAKTFRTKKIPCDVIYLDINYMEDYKIFTWNKQHFPNPKGMIDQLKGMGFHTTVIVDPGIKVEKGYTAYETGVKDNLFIKYPDGTDYTGQVWPGWCHFPDFTMPNARQWWGQQFSGYVADGIDGFWNDMNEIATWGQKMPDMVEFGWEGKKTTHLQAHNMYGMQMSRATYEGTKQLLNRRPLVLTRASYSGIQRYSAVWTGDNQANDEHLMLGVRLVNSMGLSGIAFAGYDVGGFGGSGNASLYSRWISIGALSPFFRAHRSINQTMSEPWSYGEEAEDIARKYIQFRYNLMPYIYSTFYEATQTGMPVQRSLSINYTFDNMVYDWRYHQQYLFGQFLLVAPVESNKDMTKVYLPAGTWYNLHNDEPIAGGREIVTDCPLSQLPIYVKGGAIIPMQSPVQYTLQRPTDTLTVHVYKGTETSSFVYYEDDGVTFNAQNGDFYRRTITYDAVGKKITFSRREGKSVGKFKNVRLVFHRFDDIPGNLRVNNRNEKTSNMKINYFDAPGKSSSYNANMQTQGFETKVVIFDFEESEIAIKW